MAFWDRLRFPPSVPRREERSCLQPLFRRTVSPQAGSMLVGSGSPSLASHPFRCALPTISTPDHEYGAVGVPHDRVREAAHERPPHAAQAPAPRNDQPGLQLLAKAIGEEEARRASLGEVTEQRLFVVHSEEVSEALGAFARERHRLVRVVPGSGSTGAGLKGSWLVFEASE